MKLATLAALSLVCAVVWADQPFYFETVGSGWNHDYSAAETVDLSITIRSPFMPERTASQYHFVTWDTGIQSRTLLSISQDDPAPPYRNLPAGEGWGEYFWPNFPDHDDKFWGGK